MEPVETFVFLPYSKYKVLDDRAKKPEPTEASPSIGDKNLPDENISEMVAESPTTSKAEEVKSQ